MDKNKSLTELKTDENFKKNCITVFLYICVIVVPVFSLCLYFIEPVSKKTIDNVFLLCFYVLLSAFSFIYAKVKRLFEGENTSVLFLLVLTLSIALRIYMFGNTAGDYSNYLLPWMNEMRSLDGVKPLTTPIGNYNMPYMYLLFFATKLPVWDLLIIKSFSVIFDVVLALTVVTILKKFGVRDNFLVLAFALSMTAPTFFLNSGYWGQCDSVYTALLLIGLYKIITDKPAIGCIFFGLAFSFKLQAVFIFPVLAFFIAYKLVKPHQLAYIFASFIGICLPAVFVGRSLTDTFFIYFKQTGYYSSLNMNSPSIWAIIPKEKDDYFMAAALAIAAIAIIAFTFITLIYRPLKSKTDFIELAFLYAMIVPYILPKMHERYFYIAEILAVVYLFLFPKRWKITFSVLFLGLVAYSYYLFSSITWISANWAAVVYLIVIIYAVKLFYFPDKKTSI